MRCFRTAILAVAALCALAPAHADFTVPVQGGGAITTCTKVLPNFTHAPCHIEVDVAGNPTGTVTNPSNIALPPGAATEATLGAIRILLGAGGAQDATLQAIKLLLGAPAQDASVQAVKATLGAPAQDASVQALKTTMGSPAQDATMLAIKALLGAAPAQDATLQTIKTILGSPYQAGGALPLPVGASTEVTLTGIKTALGAPAQDASVRALTTALGTPLQSGGTIGNTAFGISGALPAFAAPPTVNLGTLGGAALDSTVQGVRAALGSPYQAGGALPLPNGAATAAGQASQLTAQQAAATATGVLAGTVAAVGSPASSAATVQAAALPLPAGASTEATLGAIRTLLGAAPAQDATLQAIKAILGSPYQAGGALPLPAGAATASGQSGQLTTLQAIQALLGAAPAQDATLQAIKTLLGSPYQAGGALPLPNGAATAVAQASQLTAQQAIQAANGASADPACLTTDTTACGHIGLLKGLGSRWDRLLGFHTAPGTASAFLLGIQGAPGALPVTTATADTFTPATSKAATAGIYWDFPVGSGQATLAPTITGLTAAAGVLTATVSDDRGTTYYPVRFLGTAVLSGATTINADGIYSFAVGGHTNLRLTVTASGTGNVSVAANTSSATREVSLAGTGTAATNPLFNAPTALGPNASTETTLAKVASYTKPGSSFTATAIGAAVTPGIAIAATCTSIMASTGVFQGADGSQITVPLATGWNFYNLAIAKVVSAPSACTFTTIN